MSTAGAIWRKCIVFAKTRFADPGPDSSSRRRSRGAKGRFGPLVDGPAPLQKAAVDGGDPMASMAYREEPPRAEPGHIVTRTWCLDRGLLRGPSALRTAIGPALEASVASPVAFGPA